MAGLYDQELFSIHELVLLLSLAETTIRRLEKQGEFPVGHKIPGTKGVRWFRRDIEDYLARVRLEGKPGRTPKT